MVLPRCSDGLSSEMRDAVTSSSDSASTEESSGHSGKVRRSLLLDKESGDEGRRALEHRQLVTASKRVYGAILKRLHTKTPTVPKRTGHMGPFGVRLRGVWALLPRGHHHRLLLAHQREGVRHAPLVFALSDLEEEEEERDEKNMSSRI
ncbi:hypothetical protein EYF80_060097 [Liparis tanakae]|uniref:Uncharacterized protein n=1 Tax=Liparis tanakae TaxID=230148 RepID=A0A4Z2ELM9_9TELE|nr:hypothetical protein EYF80_060097 [Liparis tanakae]